MNGLTDYLLILGDDLALCDIEIADEEDIFVWNGVEVRKYWRNIHDSFGFFKSL